MKRKMLKKIAIFSFASVLLLAGTVAMAGGQGHHHHKPEKKGILLVAFGSSLPEARAAFGHIDKTVRSAFPDIPVRWAYTSRIIRDKLEKQGKQLNSPAQALAEMADAGFTAVAVQSLHTIAGAEYHDLVRVAERFEQMPEGIEHVRIGLPMVGGPADMEKVAQAILATIPEKRAADEAVVLMGHGTHHPANAVYAALMWQLQLADENVFVGTVEGFPKADVIIDQVKENGVEKAWLIPFMSVAGDHGQNDMAGPGKDSWRSVFENAGIECETVMKGTAEYDAFVDIWVGHLKGALSALNAE